MRKRGLIALALLAACGKSPESPPAPAAPAITTTEQTPAKGDHVEGLRIATRLGCNGCHARDGGGRVFKENREEGLIVAPNLTQRRDLYPSRAALASLLREGRTHDGHVPWGMPVKAYQHLSDQEVDALDAWLRALPAVDVPGVPAGAWSPALAAGIADGSHPWLADHRPDPGMRAVERTPAEPIALGRHLALTSCSACHGWTLMGEGSANAPPLLVARTYDAAAFARLLRTGVQANGRESASGRMSRVSRDRFHVMSDGEIAALKLYLDSR